MQQLVAIIALGRRAKLVAGADDLLHDLIMLRRPRIFAPLELHKHSLKVILRVIFQHALGALEAQVDEQLEQQRLLAHARRLVGDMFDDDSIRDQVGRLAAAAHQQRRDALLHCLEHRAHRPARRVGEEGDKEGGGQVNR